MKDLLLLFFPLLFIFGNPVNEQRVWKFVYEKDGIGVYNRESIGTDLKEFKGEVTVTATLSSIISVIGDIDNFANWAYQTRKAELLKTEGTTQYVHVVNKAQWPVLDRDIVYKCQISQNPKNKVVTILMDGIPDYIPPQNDLVRMPSAHGLFVLTPLGKNQVKITFQLNVNPGGQIPQLMANMVAFESPYVTLNNLREELKKENYRKAVEQGIAEY
jgi:hypothetical protein